LWIVSAGAPVGCGISCVAFPLMTTEVGGFASEIVNVFSAALEASSISQDELYADKRPKQSSFATVHEGVGEMVVLLVCTVS
jgi:hypothetical protein